jgi:hypothetical protein
VTEYRISVSQQNPGGLLSGRRGEPFFAGRWLNLLMHKEIVKGNRRFLGVFLEFSCSFLVNQTKINPKASTNPGNRREPQR